MLLPARRHPTELPPGVVVHRTTVLPPEDVHRMAAPPRTMPARSVVDAAAWAGSDDQACAIVAAAFQRRLVTESDIHAVLSRLPRAHRRAVIAGAAEDATGGAHSLAELRYARLNRKYGLPEPTRQKMRLDSAGRRRYLDVYYERWGVHVEIDGSQHNDPRHQWADMKRQNEIWAKGDRVLRFPAYLVRHRPDEVFGQVRAALVAAGWRPDAESGLVGAADIEGGGRGGADELLATHPAPGRDVVRRGWVVGEHADCRSDRELGQLAGQRDHR